MKTLDPRSFYKQARSLVKAGYDVTVCRLADSDQEINNVQVLGVGSARHRIARFGIINFRILRRALKHKADIYHFHDLDFVPWAVLLKALTGAKIIYDVHEAHAEYMLLKSYIPRPLRKSVSLFVHILEQISSRWFDAIIPNDNFIAQAFRHRPSVTIYNFPTLDFFAKQQEIPWRERRYDLFYHGSFPVYHAERMISIAQALVRLNVSHTWGIVTNDKKTVSWALEELKRTGLDPHFHFLPYLDYLEVARCLSDARIGIIPLPPYKKFLKNIPLKMFEFMGCGMPMVLSDLPPSRQFIEDLNCAISVEPDNINQFAEAIRTLLADPDMAARMGENGRKIVWERYNWEEEEKKLLELYSSLVDCDPKVRPSSPDKQEKI